MDADRTPSMALQVRRTQICGLTSPLVHLIAFLIASAGAFLSGNNMLLPSTDGEFTRSTVIQAFRFWNFNPGLPMAPFEGMGTILQYNPLLCPSLLPIALFGEKFGLWLGFMVCAGLIFYSTYAVGRALGIGRGASLLAAWALPPLCLPYQSWLNLYLSYNLNPAAADDISFCMLGLALVARGYTSARPYWAAAGLAAIVVWLFVANPIAIVILLPTLIPLSIGIMISHARTRGFWLRTAWLVIPSIIFVAACAGPYLLGIYSDTAAYLFGQEMNHAVSAITHTWRFVSVATVWNQGIDPIGGTWVGLAVIGLALALAQRHRPLRTIALAVFGTMILLAVYATAYLVSTSWALPYPIYYEFSLWPLYALFAAYAITEPIIGVAGWVRKNRFGAGDPAMGAERHQPRTQWIASGLVCAAGAVLAVFFAAHPFVSTDLLRPSTDTAITKFLRSQSGIVPDAPFRGYVATLTGFGGPDGGPTDWFDVLNESNRALVGFGNTDRLGYLWHYGIPTLEVYSETAGPALYAIVSRLLERPGDRQIRNILLVTSANVRLMESLGVRFLITDFELPEPAKQVVKLTAPNISHLVFELPDPNQGRYSPVTPIVAQNATEVLQLIADPQFDFRKMVVLNRSLDAALEPAASAEVEVLRGGWRIRARSPGTSLLLLPIAYSDCLAARDSGDTGRVIGVERANLVETAVIFEGTIDLTLSEQISPFTSPYCQLRDIREMKDFGLGQVPTTVPLAGKAPAS